MAVDLDPQRHGGRRLLERAGHGHSTGALARTRFHARATTTVGLGSLRSSTAGTGGRVHVEGDPSGVDPWNHAKTKAVAATTSPTPSP